MKSTPTNDTTFRWVHISDLHIGHSDYVEEAMREDLSKKLASAVGSHPMDALFITGDLIFAPTYKDNFEEIRDKEDICRTIREIQYSMGWKDDAVAAARTFIVPGNHDVVRDKSRSLMLADFEKNYNSDKGEIPGDVRTSMRNGEKRFSRLYKDILGREFIGDHHVEQGEKGTAIVCLNTTQMCEVMKADNFTKKEERAIKDSEFILGTKDIKACFHQVKDTGLAIALGHHPINSFTEAEQNVLIREMKRAGVGLYLCGHTHLAAISNIGIADYPIWQVCCGTNMERLENGNPADMKFFMGEYDISGQQGFIRAYTYKVQENLDDLEWQEDTELNFPKSEMDRELHVNTFYFPPEKANPFSVIRDSYKELMRKYADTESEVLIDQKLEMDTETIQIGSQPAVCNQSVSEARAAADNQFTPHYVVAAETGCGKTHLLQRIVKHYVLEEGGSTGDWQPALKFGHPEMVPMWISCKSLNKMSSKASFNPVDDMIGQLKLKNSYNYPYSDMFREWIRFLIRQEKLLLLVDGLDEITQDQKRSKIAEMLNTYIQDNNDVGIIITTKPYILEDDIIRDALKDYNICRLLPFDEADISEYCRKWYHENKEDADAEETDDRADDISREIAGNASVFGLARIPLFLETMLRLNEMNNILPSNQNMLYRELIYALLKKSPHAEKDVCLLSAIAFEMSERGLYQIRTRELKKMIAQIKEGCNWLFASQEKQETPADFLDRMNRTEQIFRKQSGVWEFYQGAFQNYLVATALANGFYSGLKESIKADNLGRQITSIPTVDKMFEMSLNPDKEEIVVLAAEQLDAFEAALLLHRLTEEAEKDAEGIKGSILRNLLLRMLLGGAYASKEQRSRIYQVVQSHNLSDLQADTFYQMWNSEYAEEFKQTCSEYWNEMFRMIRDSENPIQDLLDDMDEILGEKPVRWEEHDKELEKMLYVLDGFLWGYRFRYVRRLDGADDREKLEQVASLISKIICEGKENLAGVRRACGVMQRIVDLGGHGYLREGILKRLFQIYGTQLVGNSKLADDYSGIRIFGSIPLKSPFLEILADMDLCEEKRCFLKTLYVNASNTQDKSAAFRAAVLGKAWDYDEAIHCIQKDFAEFPESEAVRMRESVEQLKLEGFYGIEEENVR